MVLRNKGFGLVQFMVGMSLSGLTLVGLSHLMTLESLVRQDVTVTRTAAALRATVYRTLVKDPRAWNFTFSSTQNNGISEAQTQCLIDDTSCCTGSPICDPAEGLLVLIDKHNDTLIDSRTSTTGFNFDGAPCNTFDNTTGDPFCPIRVEVSWKAICTGSCFFPVIEVSARFLFKPGINFYTKGGKVLSLSRYNFKTTRDPDFRRSDVSFGNSITYTDAFPATPHTFLVPAGVTTIMVEAWGAGGGGSGGMYPEQSNGPEFLPPDEPIVNADSPLEPVIQPVKKHYPAGGGGGGGGYIRVFQGGLDELESITIVVGRPGLAKTSALQGAPVVAQRDIDPVVEMAGRGQASSIFFTADSSLIIAAAGGDGGMWCSEGSCAGIESTVNEYTKADGSAIFYYHGQGGQGGKPLGSDYTYPGSDGKDYHTNFDTKFVPPGFTLFTGEIIVGDMQPAGDPPPAVRTDGPLYPLGRIIYRYFGGSGGNAGGNGGLGGRNSNDIDDAVVQTLPSSPGGGGAGAGVGASGVITRAQDGAPGQVTIWY